MNTNFKYCKKCVSMTKHNDNICMLCKNRYRDQKIYIKLDTSEIDLLNVLLYRYMNDVRRKIPFETLNKLKFIQKKLKDHYTKFY